MKTASAPSWVRFNVKSIFFKIDEGEPTSQSAASFWEKPAFYNLLLDKMSSLLC